MIRWLPKFLGALFLWALVAYMIVFVDPSLVADVGITGLYLPFFVALFLALFYTASFVFRTVRFGLVLASLVVSLLMLNVLRILTVLTLLLGALFLSLVAYRFYIQKHSSPSH